MPEMAGCQHNLEEGDQLVLLIAFDVMHKNPESVLDVFSVDTDVFVLLLGNFLRLPKSTTFIPKKGERISIQGRETGREACRSFDRVVQL